MGAHTRTGGSCTKAAGRLSEPSTCKLCGRRRTMSGRRGPRPSCPSGSASGQARRPVSPTPLRTTMREQPTSQLRLKRKKKRKRKRRKNKCFLTDLLRPSDNSPSHVLHLKTSITSTSPQLPTHPKQQKTISFHESFVKVSDLVSNRLETSGLAS